VKIVSELVDIDDPNMLDKIEISKGKQFTNSCICNTPGDLLNSCGFCLSNSKKKVQTRIMRDTVSNKKFFHNNFNEVTPGVAQSFNTPGIFKYNNFRQNSENKISNAKY
jgi:hypothetical protein